MAASRPVSRAACCLSSLVRSNSLLSSGSVPTYACGYCSQQQIAHASTTTTTTHSCMHTPPSRTPTPTHTPPHSPFHAAQVAARRINRRTELDFEELRALQVAGDIALIDVRDTHERTNYGGIPGSLNIPLSKIKMALQLTDEEWLQQFQVEKPNKGDRNLVFYARGPNASSTAMEIAHRLGFKRSRQYTGGWEDYCQQTGVPLRKQSDEDFTHANYYVNRFDQYFL